VRLVLALNPPLEWQHDLDEEDWEEDEDWDEEDWEEEEDEF